MIDCIKIKDALRHRCQDMTLSQISVRLDVSKSTLRGWLQRCDEMKISYETAKNLTPTQIAKALNLGHWHTKPYYEPNFDELVASSIEGKYSAQRAYELYCKEVPSGLVTMSRSSFFRRFKDVKDSSNPNIKRLFLHNSFRPGTVVMIDYSGDGLILNDTNGTSRKVQIFVSVLGYSGLIFCCATYTQTRKDWLKACGEMFSFYGGVTDEIWLDNSTTCVRRPSHVDPVLAPEFENFCKYYQTEAIAVAPNSPRHKGLVENAVRQVQHFILSEMSTQRFFSLEEINRCLTTLLQHINKRALTNHPNVTRQDRFDKEEKLTLKPLPLIPYDSDAVQVQRKVLKGNQVRINNVRYNIPMGYVGKKLNILINQRTLEMVYFLEDTGEKIATARLRSLKEGDEPMRVEFLPDYLQPYVMSREALVMKIEKELGRQAIAFAHVLARQANSKAKKHLMALLRAAKRFSGAELEAICSETLACNDVTFATFKKICTAHEDKPQHKSTHRAKRLATNTAVITPTDVRGSEYFNDGENHDVKDK